MKLAGSHGGEALEVVETDEWARELSYLIICIYKILKKNKAISSDI